VASSEVRAPNPQVARVDSRLSISGAPPTGRKAEKGTNTFYKKAQVLILTVRKNMHLILHSRLLTRLVSYIAVLAERGQLR